MLPLPGAMLPPDRSCYVLTGHSGATAGFECRVFVGIPENPPVAPPDGFWPDEGGSIVLFDDPLGLLADVVRYNAEPAHQSPPPNPQARVNAPMPLPPLRFTLVLHLGEGRRFSDTWDQRTNAGAPAPPGAAGGRLC